MQPLNAVNGAVIVGTLASPDEPVSSDVDMALLQPGAHLFDASEVPCGSINVSWTITVAPASGTPSTCTVDVLVGNRLDVADPAAALPVDRDITSPTVLASLSNPAVETSAHVVIDATSKYAQLKLTISGAAMYVKAIGAAL